MSKRSRGWRSRRDSNPLFPIRQIGDIALCLREHSGGGTRTRDLFHGDINALPCPARASCYRCDAWVPVHPQFTRGSFLRCRFSRTWEGILWLNDRWPALYLLSYAAKMVATGLEPATPCLKGTRAASCATLPYASKWSRTIIARSSRSRPAVGRCWQKFNKNCFPTMLAGA